MRIIIAMLLLAGVVSAAEQSLRVQVTGLFMKEREGDLEVSLAKMPGVKLSALDFKTAEATLTFDQAVTVPNTKPQDVLMRLDSLLKTASNNTFGLKTPLVRDGLKWIEIPAAGLDCKACSLAAYEIVIKIDGVAQATASFREGKITALIDPERTDRGKIETVLKLRGVTLTSPEKQP